MNRKTMEKMTMEQKKQQSRKELFRRVAMAAMVFMAAFILTQNPVITMAAENGSAGSITSSFDNLKEVVTSIISGIGTIITLWGISEWGLSYQGSDGMSQAQGFKRIAGGLVMLLAPQILEMLT